MKLLIIATFLFCSSLTANANVPLTARENYSRRLHNAFMIQSIGETRVAYRAFKAAYQDALAAGESLSKLRVINDLFVWYRTYGWSCGIMMEPARCSGEHGGDWNRNYQYDNLSKNLCFGENINYQAEWNADPRRAKHVRNYIIGVAEILSFIFLANVPVPGGGLVSALLLSDGFNRIVNSLHDAYSERQQLIYELKKIEARAAASVKE